MGINAVQQYAKGLVNGVTSAYYPASPLVAYIVPPNPGQLTGPAAYVWVTQGQNRRQTSPRGAGFRKTDWTVSVWLMSPDVSTNPNADQAFACLVDAVVAVWISTPMPLLYSDPTTGATSQLLSVGEEYSIEQSPVHALADQRLILYEALLKFTIKEAAQP